MNPSAPRSTVEAGNVRPDSNWRDRSFLNARRNSAGDRSFPFHRSDGPVSGERNFKSKLEAEGASAESDSE